MQKQNEFSAAAVGLCLSAGKGPRPALIQFRPPGSASYLPLYGALSVAGRIRGLPQTGAEIVGWSGKIQFRPTLIAPGIRPLPQRSRRRAVDRASSSAAWVREIMLMASLQK